MFVFFLGVQFHNAPIIRNENGIHRPNILIDSEQASAQLSPLKPDTLCICNSPIHATRAGKAKGGVHSFPAMNG